MAKSLIIYFSHSKENYIDGNIQWIEEGNTHIVANKIKNKTYADIFEILPLHDYPSAYQECVDIAKKEKEQACRPKIKNLICHMENYDTLYLGYPNWWGTMPMILFTLLESYDFKDKHIYPFCTHEGSGLGQSVQDIKKTLPQAYVYEGLAIKGSFVQQCDDLLEKWLGEKICQ